MQAHYVLQAMVIGFCLRTTFSLYSVRSARFQTACSLGYYTVFSDSKKRPLERHNSALASRRLDCQCSATLRVPRGPRARHGRIRKLGAPVPLCDSSCGGLTPGRAPAPARGVERRAASHVSIGNRNQQSNRSRLYLRRSKKRSLPPEGKNSRVSPEFAIASVPVYNILDFGS